MRLPATMRFLLRITLLATLGALSLATGCATYKGYQGPDLPDDQVAILDWSGWLASSVIEIDGKPTPVEPGRIYTRAKLLPRPHSVVYGKSRPQGFFTEGYHHRLVANISMEAGHVYAVKFERVPVSCIGDRFNN